MGERRWEELSSDCLIAIFSKLGLEDLTIGVPFVCKSWHRASLDPQCWKILNFKDVDFTYHKFFTYESEFITRFKQQCRILKFSYASFMKLCLSKSHGSAVNLSIPSKPCDTMHQDLIFASTKCPGLKILTLPPLNYNDNEVIPRVIARWKDLEVFEIESKPMFFWKWIEEIGANCPKFAGLRTRGYFDEIDAERIVKCLPKLRTLILRGSTVKRDELVFIFNGCKELQEVDVSRCRGFDPDDQILKEAASGIKKFTCEGSRIPKNIDYYFPDDPALNLLLGFD